MLHAAFILGLVTTGVHNAEAVSEASRPTGAIPDAVASASERSTAELIAALGSDDCDARDDAAKSLIDSKFTLAEIEAALRRPDLSCEQRFRLSQAGFERFISSPRAAMGVRFGEVAIDGRQAVRMVEPQFPAAKVLKPDDQIVRIGDIALQSSDRYSGRTDYRPLIISRDPGDIVPMEIMRGGARVRVDVPLGAWGMFDHTGPAAIAQPISEDDFRVAWALRLGRITPREAEAPIVAVEPEGGWSADHGAPLNSAPSLPLVPGGMPRRVAGGGEAFGEGVRVALNQGRGPQVIVQLGGGQAGAAWRRAELNQQIAEWAKLVAEAEKKAMDPALTPEERQNARLVAQTIQSQLQLFELQRRMMDERRPAVQVMP